MVKEIGILVKHYPESNDVIHWMVTAKGTASKDSEIGNWKQGDSIYNTSLGWQSGLSDKSNYFEPTLRERSMRPALNRALDYSKKKWPGLRSEIH